MASPSFAQESAHDFLEPRVDRQHFVALCQPLHLGPDQLTITELAFTDYTSTLTDLAGVLDDQAEKAGRRTVQDALAGRARVAPDELKRMRVAVLRVYEQGWPAIDQALEQLLGSIESVLTPSQAAIFDQEVRGLRRQILLHPRQSASDYQEYAGDGVDVLLLAERALQEGGELHAVGRAALQEILASYEQQLDELLVQTASAHRQGKLMRKIASIEKDIVMQRQQEQAALAQWKQLYELNQFTIRRIGEAAANTSGEQARQQWLDRCDQAAFAWLYPRKKPDRQIEWMRQQHLPAEKLQQAETIYEVYLTRRKALSRQAIELMVRGRLEFQTMLYSMMDASSIDDRVRRSLHEDLLKNTGEQANLESTTSGALEALLTDAQRQSMREVMKGPDRATRRR